MKLNSAGPVIFPAFLALGAATTAAPQARTLALEGASGLDLRNVLAAPAEHRGKKAVRIVEVPGVQAETIAIVSDSSFEDGTIELELASQVLAGAPPTSRGFVAVAFRVDPKSLAYDCFYLRPENGRADDQLRRNHSAQYISHPEFPWHRLRKEQPGVYESYVDLEPGAWTKLRVVVKGGDARLFVHGAEQPTLVVTDMKRTPTRGPVALWIGQGTEAFFRNLTITQAARP
jgi:hypothetical protein